MNPPCRACIKGPLAIDGHAALGVRTIGSTVLTFECRLCGTKWARSVDRGVFSWSQIDERASRSLAMGSLVPPRSDPFTAQKPPEPPRVPAPKPRPLPRRGKAATRIG